MSDQFPQYPQDPQQTQAHQQAYGQQPHTPAPQTAYQAQPPTISAEDERTWGAISHAGAVIAMICSAGFLGFVASVAVYMIYKDRGPFVRAHAANSINIQITMFIWLVVLGILTIPVALLTLGIGLVVMLPALAAAFVVAGVLHVIGTVKAYNGEWWNPPFTPRFVK
ncbi:hypothetical protein SAMN05192575_103103 [Nocardioides alpinus]|uniref:DUF4870 domain-containing protein n=1 Tax=Nocardioides alpinus TaxID=748909 RepID=A0A1I0XXC9_9ACTN|nr:DUF4870 domain-containing protein [Nocardioides alpinus]PKH42776.1 DUF4870 domain-containing protein [Nocardioides alpinus]SFB05672.1 hypothetical protein SAMN05192575_103103 [Nocardioides alpinus]